MITSPWKWRHLKAVIVPSGQSPPSMLKLHDFCTRAGARILWCTPVFGQAVGTQHIDEILAVWYPTHKTFLDLSDAPGAKESYSLRGACVAYAAIRTRSGTTPPLDGTGHTAHSAERRAGKRGVP